MSKDPDFRITLPSAHGHEDELLLTLTEYHQVVRLSKEHAQRIGIALLYHSNGTLTPPADPVDADHYEVALRDAHKAIQAKNEQICDRDGNIQDLQEKLVSKSADLVEAHETIKNLNLDLKHWHQRAAELNSRISNLQSAAWNQADRHKATIERVREALAKP